MEDTGIGAKSFRGGRSLEIATLTYSELAEFCSSGNDKTMVLFRSSVSIYDISAQARGHNFCLYIANSIR